VREFTAEENVSIPHLWGTCIIFYGIWVWPFSILHKLSEVFKYGMLAVVGYLGPSLCAR
jgi:hypothetical protein